MKWFVAAYLLTLAPSLGVPAAHEKCDDVCHAHKLAREAQITSNYRGAVTRKQQIERDRARLALLYVEQSLIARAIERTKKGKL